MKIEKIEARAEPKAKVALLNFLRTRKMLTKKSSVSTELILDKHAVRADLVLCTAKVLRSYEIKTDKDTLSRLSKQIESYSRHTDYVTVVAATKHINTVISRVPLYVGIYELVSFSGSIEVRVVREPTSSPLTDTTAMLSLVPASVIRELLPVDASSRRRADIMAVAASQPNEAKRDAVIEFFRARYQPNTLALIALAHRRAIRPTDLTVLRRWSRDTSSDTTPRSLETPRIEAADVLEDGETYRFVGRSFGPVPEEVRAMLTD